MSATTQPETLLDLINRLGMSVTFVGKQLGWAAPRFYQGQVARGLITQLEVDRLAEVLRVDRSVVEAALRENARRHQEAKASGGAADGKRKEAS